MDLSNYCIGFDRDGTLEAENSPFPSALARKINILQQKGAFLFFASGREVAILQKIASSYGIDFDLIAGESGADIVGQQAAFSFPDLMIFKEKIQTFDLPPHKKDPHKKIIWTHYFFEHLPEAVKIVEKIIKENHLKLTVFPHPDYDGALDIVPEQVDKKNILPFLPKGRKILYFGDSENDYQLMNSPEVIPYTFANGIEKIKNLVIQKKGIVSEKIAGEGVLDILNQLFPGL